MTLNSLLIWTVAASCGLSLFQLTRRRNRAWGRIGTAGFIAVLLGIFYLADPERAGYYGAAVWFLLLVAPGLGFLLVDVLIGRKRYGPAKLLARGLSWLQPFDEDRVQPELIEALQLFHRGEGTRAQQILDSLKQAPSRTGTTVFILQTRQRGDWEGFLDWFRSQPGPEQLLDDPLVLDAYLQALGETNRLGEFLSEFRRLLIDRPPHVSPGTLNLLRMKGAAFGGDPELVEQVFDVALADLSPNVRTFWRATAMQVAADDAAAEELERLSRCGEAVVARAARRRLAEPLMPPPRDAAAGPADAVLSHIGESIHHERRFVVMSGASTGRPWATWGLAAVLLTVFLFELPGGSQDPLNLIEMGALVIPMSLVEGEWWRIVTAAFLHFGPLHLGLNMVGLLLFGMRLERAWGSLSLLVCYLTAAVLSIALTAYFSPEATARNPTILVGASGGVMGLVGVLLGNAGIGRLRGRSPAVSREFNLLFLIVVLQVIFDANHENVSSKCHLLGLGIGLLYAAAANLVRTRS